jgi:hypothetical protein
MLINVTEYSVIYMHIQILFLSFVSSKLKFTAVVNEHANNCMLKPALHVLYHSTHLPFISTLIAMSKMVHTVTSL